MNKKLFISFSGGKTSARMADFLLKTRSEDTEIITVFANTGQEHEETLKFIKNCDEQLGFKTIWIEAVINPGRNGTTHKIVNYETANRDGAPFEAMIKKYGIPNKAYPHCTRELKQRPMESLMRTLEWTDNEIAIGIRTDEKRRVAKDAEKRRFIYPLITEIEADQDDINDFWDKQAFNLNIPAYLGNCLWCWKKSDKKHFLSIKRHSEYYSFPERMERDNGLCGNGSDIRDKGTRVFFRQNRSTLDMRATAQEMSLDHLIHMVDPESEAGCATSCQPFI